MIVVSDASPVHYLLLIDHIDVLPHLFGRVMIPPAVAAELSRSNTPMPVRSWIQSPPSWLEVRKAAKDDPQIKLGLGERQAICLAREFRADVLLIDDRKARRFAEREGLAVAGTLNVLQAAAERGLLDLATAIEKLRQTNFHVSERLLRHVVQNPAGGQPGKPPEAPLLTKPPSEQDNA